MNYLVYGVLSINLLAIILIARDKQLAKRKSGRRIAEKAFLLLAAMGGSIGIWFAMYLFHHKTKHKRFIFGVPLIIVLQICILLYVFQV